MIPESLERIIRELDAQQAVLADKYRVPFGANDGTHLPLSRYDAEMWFWLATARSRAVETRDRWLGADRDA